MDEKARSEKDLEKLKALLTYFRTQPFSAKYTTQLDFAETYWKDAKYYYEKGDFFTAFGCANYAYGILEGILIIEKGKTFHELEKEATKKSD